MSFCRKDQVGGTESTDPTKYENDHYVLLSIHSHSKLLFLGFSNGTKNGRVLS